MHSQVVANKLLSLAVNVGLVPAAKMLQDALMVVGDGRIGPLTLHALDSVDVDELVNRLRDEAEDYYRRLVEARPELTVYRAGWLRRAEA